MYQLLTDKVGDDTAQAMFKYIDNRAKRSAEAGTKALATKEEVKALVQAFNNLKTENKRWLLVFGLMQVGVWLAIVWLLWYK